MVLGPQFHDPFGPEPVKSKAISIINKSADSDNPVITGSDARAVFRAANIRQWPMQEYYDQNRDPYPKESEWNVPRTQPLNTSQNYLHAETVRKYMQGDEPEFDKEFGEDSDVPYQPDILESPRGRLWIDEGHHRMVASRLRGDSSRRSWMGYFK